MVETDALPIAEEEIREVRDLSLSGDLEHGSGTLTTWDAREAYYDKIASLVNVARPMKVVVDTGNGVAGLFAPEMLRRLGCEVVELYTEPDSTFPNHLPDPEDPKNMADLMALVPQVGAEVGLAWDGDGDRLGVCDEKGFRWEADFINILFARDLLTRHPGATVLLDVKSSLNTLADVKAHGGDPQLGKTGHSFMKRRMKAEGRAWSGACCAGRSGWRSACQWNQCCCNRETCRAGASGWAARRRTAAISPAACWDRAHRRNWPTAR